MTINNAIDHQLLFPLRSFVAAKPLASLNNVLSQPASQPVLGLPFDGGDYSAGTSTRSLRRFDRRAAEPDPRVLTQ